MGGSPHGPRALHRVAADPDRLFEALSTPEQLTRFVPQLTGVSHGDGDRVEVEARYEGTTHKRLAAAQV